MRPVVRNAAILIVIVIVAVAAFFGGWYLKPANSNGSSATTLGIIAAGSLAPNSLFPFLASEYANVTPGISAPISAQLYEGSTAAATAIVSAGTNSPYDIFVSADYRVIPQDLISHSPSYATGEIVFASDPMVLAYNSALSNVNSSNWWQKITASGVTLGAPNASSDPLGQNVIFTLELQDTAAGQGGALYNHFFTGGFGALATPTTNTKFVTENTAGTALSTNEVQAYLIYESYAEADGLTFTTLNSSVNLGGTSPADVANYGHANTTVLSGTGTKMVVGAPALFALTVPTNAPSAAVGNAFAAWLLSNATAPSWLADGFLPTPAMWAYGSVAFYPPGATALPSYLASLI